MQVWSDAFDRAGGSTLGVQRELGQAIAEQVRNTLPPARADALARRHSRNEAAYDAFLAFRRALALDPSYALAHLTLGHLLSQSGRYGEAAGETRRARELEPFDPVTWALSSQVAFQARDTRLAIEHARRAIALSPGFWFGHQMLGQALAQDGRYDEALEKGTSVVSHGIRLQLRV